MRTLSRDTWNRIKLMSTLCLILLALSSFAPGHGLALGKGTPYKPDRSRAAAATNGTIQDFDTAGTPYVLGVHLPAPTQAPKLIDDGPTVRGKALRLAFGAPPISHNSIDFQRTASGVFAQIVADFDFRIAPGTGRADGMGFALLNTATYGITGTVAPHLAPFAAEEPNYTGSLGIGFDIYKSGAPAPDSNDNHVSVHYNGVRLAEFDATPAVDLAASRWIHARIIVRPGGGNSDVTVRLAQCGQAPVTVVDHYKVNGLAPYEGRVHFIARSGGQAADHDLDNIRVQFMDLGQAEPGILALRAGCASAIETDGKVQIAVERTGNTSAPATVQYATANNTATAGADYTATPGTLTFGANETTKIVSIAIADDTLNEGDESFLLSLSDPGGNAILGGPQAIKVTIVDDEAARAPGHWSDIIPIPVVPIHMHLLPNAKVMFWDRHNETEGWDGDPRIWDPITQQISTTATLPYDIFCSGHSLLEDGRLLVTGGHIKDLAGEDKASIYDPVANTWTRLPKMNAGRWYPSNVSLANGDVLVVGGTYTPTGTMTPVINPLPQVWQPASNSWRDLTNAIHSGLPNYADFYPFLYVAPNGKVFDAGPQQMARYLDTSGTGRWTDVARSSMRYRDYGTSVIYDTGKVLITGGSPDRATWTPAITTEVIDLNANTPAWKLTDPMHFARRHANATLLPDGQVLVTGGSSQPGFDNQAGAVLQPEIWNPATGKWTLLAPQARYRGYHSTALLLPDGRVLLGGGGHPPETLTEGLQSNFEIYSPPYLFNGPRPTISHAPKQVSYGQPFVIMTPDATNISAIRLIRLASVTHSFNQNQATSRLTIISRAGALKVTAPDSPNLAPPGHYMLFILNDKGVPSVAQIIQLVDESVKQTFSVDYLPIARRAQ